MKKCIVISIIMIMFVVYGCNNTDNNDTTTGSTGNTTENTTTGIDIPTTKPVEIKDEDRGEAQLIDIIGAGDAERLGVEKSIIWVLDSMVTAPKEKQVNALNDLLVKEYGCDFTVEIHRYPTEVNSNYQYNDIVKDMMQLGHRADLIFSSVRDWYTWMTEQGLYEPLNEELVTADGQKLWGVYSEEVWKMAEREGEIYGVLPTSEPFSRYVIGCNKAMAEKYGIVLPEKYSFYDLEEIVGAMEEKGETFEGVCPIVADYTTLIAMEGYYNEAALGKGIYFKKNDSGSWMAVNPAEEEQLVALIKQVNKYIRKGWYGSVENNIVKQEESFIFYIALKKNAELVDNRITILMNSESGGMEFVTHELIIGDVQYSPYSKTDNWITGIASWSEYKDEAFKFLTLLHTEEKLSNLMYFGIEGEDWRYDDENREVILLPSGRTWARGVYFTAFSNMNLIPSVYLEPDDKITYIKEISAGHEEGPFMVHDVDISAHVDKMKVINSIYIEYIGELMSGGCGDLDGTFAKMKAELEAAGINEIVDDINRQMQTR